MTLTLFAGANSSLENLKTKSPCYPLCRLAEPRSRATLPMLAVIWLVMKPNT